MMAKVNSKDTETVINALVKHAHQLPREFYASLTWDRGKEMADHRRFTRKRLLEAAWSAG
jgi:IS30 family transposase